MENNWKRLKQILKLMKIKEKNQLITFGNLTWLLKNLHNQEHPNFHEAIYLIRKGIEWWNNEKMGKNYSFHLSPSPFVKNKKRIFQQVMTIS